MTAVRYCEPDHVFRSVSTGQVVPAYCRAWRCGRCGPKRARRVMAVAYWSGLHRFATFTLVGETWAQRRARMKALRYEVWTQTGKRVHWAWTVEPNPRATGHHVHALVGGDWLHVDRWRDCCDAVGMGRRMRIEWAHADGAGHYSVKAGLYSTKGCAGGPDAYGAWLDLAGGRGVHWSRRAFGERPFPEAYTAMLSSKGWLSSDPGPWVREPARV